MKDAPILLMTACINPNGMAHTAIQNVEDRMSQYMHAINFYLEQTVCKIVFCENSGIDISQKYEHVVNHGRMEILTFRGNDYNSQLGKGYGEYLIVAYALSHSKMLNDKEGGDKVIVKVSGRHIVRNIASLISMNRLIVRNEAFVSAHINRKTKGAISDLYIATMDFHRLFVEHGCEIDESKGVWYEHVLYDAMRIYQEQRRGTVLNLPQPLVQMGCSGSTGQTFPSPTPMDYLSSFLKCIVYRLGFVKLV